MYSSNYVLTNESKPALNCCHIHKGLHVTLYTYDDVLLVSSMRVFMITLEYYTLYMHVPYLLHMIYLIHVHSSARNGHKCLHTCVTILTHMHMCNAASKL